MVILAHLLFFIGLAVMLNTVFVVVYNRYLSMMHESTLKKVVALAGLPMGTIMALLSTVMLRGFCSPLILIVILLSISGWIVTVHRIFKLRNQRKNDWATDLKQEVFPYTKCAGSPINFQRLKPSHQLILRLLSSINGVGNLTINRADLKLEQLDQEFDGYKIVHLTDFHLHHTLKMEWFEFVIERVMAEKPDLILFGGDLISKYSHVERVAPYLKKLSAPDGVIFISGNHDFWKSPQRLKRFCKEAGYLTLSNEYRTIIRGKEVINILGFETPYIGLTAKEKLAFVQLNGPRIGLVHTPEAYAEAARAGCDIAFSGHTHGGQVRLPVFGTTICGCPVPIDLADGRSTVDQMKTWTSRGVGSFFPLRFRCAPELVSITLRS